jgi:hypothetical protein
MAQISTGIGCIDLEIGGGINPQSVTLLYGEPDTGKSALVMQCAVNCAVQNRKVLFVDCDNTFYAKRLSQIAGNRFDEVAERIVLIKPKDFREQTAFIDSIQDYTANVGLIIIDTFTSLYSAKAAETTSKSFSVNRGRDRSEAHADVGALPGLQGHWQALSGQTESFARGRHASDGDGSSSGIGQGGRLSLGFAQLYAPETHAGWGQFDPASQNRGAFQREGGGQTNHVAGEDHPALGGAAALR